MLISDENHESNRRNAQHSTGLPLRSQLDLLERSFTTALHELRQLQKERKAQARQAGSTGVSLSSARKAPVQHQNGVMPEGAGDHPSFCAPDL